MIESDYRRADFEALLRSVNNAKIDFLRAELGLALTMAQMALDSDDSPKCERNKRNARKAYDTILKFRSGVVMTPQEREELNTKLNQLRVTLEELGEQFNVQKFASAGPYSLAAEWESTPRKLTSN